MTHWSQLTVSFSLGQGFSVRGGGHFQAVHPFQHCVPGDATGDTTAFQPHRAGCQAMEVRGAGADAAAAGGAEGPDGLAGEVIGLQEGADDPEGLAPPDGIDQKRENHKALIAKNYAIYYRHLFPAMRPLL